MPPNLQDTIVCGNPAHGLPRVPPDPNGRQSYSFLLFTLGGNFRATVHMIRADLYHGQPCPQAGGTYVFNPLNGYYRCEVSVVSGRPALVMAPRWGDSSLHAGRTVIARLNRRLAMAALGAAIALLAVSMAAGGASSASGGQLETVTIATPPFEPAALAFYANARGLFRKHGIDAKLVVTADPGAGVATMLAGDAHFTAIHAGGPALLRSRGAPVRLVAAGALYQPTAPPTAGLVSARGKRFAAARELVGKRVGYDAPGTIAHVALMKWLKRGGVRDGDVTLVRGAFPDMIGALARGDVDAAVLPEPFLTVARRQGGKLVAPIFQSVCASECLLTAWIARSDVDRNLAARFRNAIQEAATWANQQQNDAASGAILARHANIEKKLLTAMARSRFGTRLRLPRIQPWIDAYKEFGLIPEAFTAGDLVK